MDAQSSFSEVVHSNKQANKQTDLFYLCTYEESDKIVKFLHFSKDALATEVTSLATWSGHQSRFEHGDVKHNFLGLFLIMAHFSKKL